MQQLPHLLGALAIFILGWLVALLVRAAVRKSLAFIGLNRRLDDVVHKDVNVESAIATMLFWLVMLITVGAVFSALNLAEVTGTFSAFTQTMFGYAPQVLGAVALTVVAWVVATLVRTVSQKLLDKTQLDEKLSAQAGVAPISDSLSNVLFWLVILIFLPAILGVLQLHGLLEPLRAMTTRALEFVPNAFAALAIGAVGWLIASILRRIVTHLLQAAGTDKLLGDETAGRVELSRLAGTIVFIAVLLPTLIAALDALRIEAVSRPATDMLNLILIAVPNIIAAGLILLVTWYVARFATQLLATLLQSIGFDRLPAALGAQHAFTAITPSQLVARIALLFAMLFAVVEAANRLGFAQVGDIVGTFIRFGGDIALGAAILVIGFWLANLAHDAIDHGSGANTSGLAKLARVAILGLVAAMGLRAMGIANEVVHLAFGLTLGAVAVAVALSFGLGGREAAGKLMEHWLSKFRKD
ncbi:MAG: hypothetical protein FJY56_18990 [Betaproteobacteria bacterium]|nr:hypothetical protein [Betaproteobacteria bacterium]